LAALWHDVKYLYAEADRQLLSTEKLESEKRSQRLIWLEALR
jgi:hypothetical protein